MSTASDLDAVYTDLTRRKVVQYVTVADDYDALSGGHGSHVAGTILGRNISGG